MFSRKIFFILMSEKRLRCSTNWGLVLNHYIIKGTYLNTHEPEKFRKQFLSRRANWIILIFTPSSNIQLHPDYHHSLQATQWWVEYSFFTTTLTFLPPISSTLFLLPFFHKLPTSLCLTAGCRRFGVTSATVFLPTSCGGLGRFQPWWWQLRSELLTRTGFVSCRLGGWSAFDPDWIRMFHKEQIGRCNQEWRVVTVCLQALKCSWVCRIVFRMIFSARLC